MKKTTLIIALLILSGIANSQSIRTQHAYGGSVSDYFQSFRQTPDGGLILAGSTSSYGTMQFSTDQNIYLIKTDEYDNVEWSRTFAYSTHIDEAIDVFSESSDSSYFVLSNFRDSSFNNLFFGLSKLDNGGNVLWNKTYSLNGHICFASAIKKVNNDFLIAGSVYIDAQHNYDAFLLKVNNAGIEQWCKTYSTQASYLDKAFAINSANDGGYLLTGVSYYNLIHDYAMLAIKTDSMGNLSWANTYANSLNSRCVGGYQLSDGTYILGGQAVNFGPGANDFLMMQTDSAGTPVWTKVYGDSFIQLAAGLTQTSEGPVLIGTTNTNSLPMVLFLETDFSGNVLSSYAYGDTLFSQSGKQCIYTASNGFLIGGERVGSFNQGNSAEDFLLVKADSNYSSGCFESAFTPVVNSITVPFASYSTYDSLTVSDQDIIFDIDSGYVDTTFCQTITQVQSNLINEGGVQVFPNPSSGNLTIRLPKVFPKNVSLAVFNSLGEKIFNSVYSLPYTNELHLSLNLTRGIYFLKVHGENGKEFYQKILIEG